MQLLQNVEMLIYSEIIQIVKEGVTVLTMEQITWFAIEPRALHANLILLCIWNVIMSASKSPSALVADTPAQLDWMVTFLNNLFSFIKYI